MEFGAMLLLSRPEGKSQARVYAEAIEQIELAEALGLDTLWLAEHHFSPGMLPHRKALQSMERLARHVMPALRG